MNNQMCFRSLTDEDRLILETIRERCLHGKTRITQAEWKAILKSRPGKYIQEILNIHKEELKTIRIVGGNHYSLTMHGVLMLDDVYLMLSALFAKMPYAV